MGERLTEEEFEDVMRAADSDSDGKINFEEFVRMICV